MGFVVEQCIGMSSLLVLCRSLLSCWYIDQPHTWCSNIGLPITRNSINGPMVQTPQRSNLMVAIELVSIPFCSSPPVEVCAAISGRCQAFPGRQSVTNGG